MKVPVRTDLRRASFTLFQWEDRGYITQCHIRGGVNFVQGTGLLGSGEGRFRSNSPVTPSQIMARASVARANCDWDKAAIFSRSCLLVPLSAPLVDSSFILLTSLATCTDNISGKLFCENERFEVARGMVDVAHERENPENTSSTMLQCARVSRMCAFACSLSVGMSY